MQIRALLIGLAISGLTATGCASTSEESSEGTVSGAGEPASIGQAAVDAINETSDSACATNLRTIETALEAHFAINGSDASTLADLDEILADDLSDSWTLEPLSGGASAAPRVVPVPGGACDGQ